MKKAAALLVTALVVFTALPSAYAEAVKVSPGQLWTGRQEARPCTDMISASMGWCQMVMIYYSRDSKTGASAVLGYSSSMTENNLPKAEAKLQRLQEKAKSLHRSLLIDTETGDVTIAQ